MTKQAITIKIDPRKNFVDDSTEEIIEADVKDGLAIHPSIAVADFWTVTHVNSGIACASYKTKKMAQEKRKLLAEMSVAGVRFVEMSACEALAVFPRLAEQFLHLNDRMVNEKTMAAAIANRDYISEVICKVAA